MEAMEVVFDDLPLRRRQAARIAVQRARPIRRGEDLLTLTDQLRCVLDARQQAALVILRKAVYRHPYLVARLDWQLTTLRGDVAHDAHRFEGDEPLRDELIDDGQKRVHLLLRIDDLDQDRQVG
jgi:hypothetical protein